MALNTVSRDIAHPEPAVVEWLLDADPAIRWQVLRDITGAPAAEVAAERARVATEGWGAELLDRQRPEGNWGDGERVQHWEATLNTLVLLREMGLDPSGERARAAIGRVRDLVTWGPYFGDSPFFEGEVEPCINGAVLALGSYFAEASEQLVERLLGEQLEDGGWNCEVENGSVRSSFHTTIRVLEGFLAYEQANGATPAVTAARRRGEAYLLERRLLRSRSTGEVIDPVWTELSFPTTWHYDVLRGLDYFRAAGFAPDERMAEAAAIVAQRRGADGRWPLQNPHPDHAELDMEGVVGSPSRWNTLRALRVLRWYTARS